VKICLPWSLWLNFSKCSILTVSRKDPTLYDYYIKDDTCDLQLQRCDSTKDLGVIIDSNLTFEDHITEKVNKAYSVLGIIKRNFEHISKDAFVLLPRDASAERGNATVSHPSVCLSVCLSVRLSVCL